jgi:hypothetical protein
MIISAPAGATPQFTVEDDSSDGLSDDFTFATPIATNLTLQILDANNGNANLSSQTNTVIVGQQMNLTCQLSVTNSYMTSFPLSNFQWTVPGYAISNYVVAADTSSAMVITNFPTSNTNVTFYWVDGASNRIVQCSATVNGKTITGQAAFNVLRPTDTVQAKSGIVTIDGIYGEPTLRFGVNIAGLTGMGFSNSITMPNGYTGNTNIQWVQEGISFLETEETNDGSGIWYSTGQPTNNVLDTFYPYPPDSASTASDSPHSRGLNNYIAVTCSGHFNMWLMFKPDGGQWVPLRSVNWSWSGTGTNDFGLWVLSSHTNSINPSDINTSTYPVWTQNLTNFFTPHQE